MLPLIQRIRCLNIGKHKGITYYCPNNDYKSSLSFYWYWSNKDIINTEIYVNFLKGKNRKFKDMSRYFRWWKPLLGAKQH